MRKQLLILLTCILSFNSQAQTNLVKFESPISPAPNAASMGKYGDIPVSTYTGIPNISIPIYDIKIKKNTVPVNLSYHAGGFKVNEEASWVGLGWTLNSGGVITRTKKGFDDLSSKGYYKYSDHGIIGDGTDKEPDMFYFNFLGFSGKFLIDYSSDVNKPYSIKFIGSYDDDVLDIKLINDSYWIFTDKYGIVYQFNTAEVTNEDIVSQGRFSGSSYSTNYTSSWFLSKIVYPTTEEVIFNYNPGPQIISVPTVDYIFNKKNGYSTSVPISCYNPSFSEVYANESTVTTHNVKINTQVLKEIIFPNGKMEFNSVLDRIDLKCTTGKAARLSNIKLYSQNSGGYDLLRTFNFSQSYFSSSSGDNTLSKRLKFDQFYEIGEGNKKTGRYDLYYNNVTLPDKDSKASDHWGYFNGSTESSITPTATSKNPNPTYVKAGLLENIIYPTSGKATFVFEINDFSNLGSTLAWTSSNSANTGLIGAGVRIKSITTASADNPSEPYLKKEFDYSKNNGGVVSSSGQIMSNVNYHSPNNTVSSYQYTVGECAKYFGTVIRYFSDILYASSSVPISGDAQGNVVGYDLVTIKDVGINSTLKTVDEFNNYSLANSQLYPRVPTNNNNLNGLLKSRTSYTTKGGVEFPVKKIDFEYSVQSSDLVRNYIYGSSMTGSPMLYGYDVVCQWITSSKKTEIDFDPDGGTNKTAKISNFIYDNSDKQKKKEDYIDSKGDSYSIKYLYPKDMVSLGFTIPYQTMQSRNMIGVVVQKEEYKGTTLLNKTFTDFATNWPKNPSLILPSTVRSQFMLDDPENRLIYHSYDNKGNVLTFSYGRGPKTSFLYSYNQQYPIAEIKNVEFSEIENILGVDNISVFGNLPKPDRNDIDNFILPLKAGLPNAMISTYSYQPLVGVTSKIDEKNQVSYYEYDDFERLKNIKDQNKNIVKNFRYNYKEILVVYKNDAKSVVFTKQCTEGQGTLVTYTVAEGKYTSTESVALANALADADIAANGQNYANANGTCAPLNYIVTATSISTPAWTIVGYLVNKSTNKSYLLIAGANPERNAVVPAGEYRLDLSWDTMAEAGKSYLINLNGNIQTVPTSSGSKTSFDVTVDNDYYIIAQHR